MFKAGEGAGRSGSFFFSTYDNKYIIKTMSYQELRKLLSMAEEYTEHFRNNPRSLICKIFGVFKVKIATTSKVYLMLMENTLQFRDEANIDFIFDLKGSTVARKYNGKITQKTTLKDVNFLLAKKVNPLLVNLRTEDRDTLMNALHADVRFLQGQKLMDYSLLLGIETRISDSPFDSTR